jgi:hypothetical protein
MVEMRRPQQGARELHRPFELGKKRFAETSQRAQVSWAPV